MFWALSTSWAKYREAQDGQPAWEPALPFLPLARAPQCDLEPGVGGMLQHGEQVPNMLAWSQSLSRVRQNHMGMTCFPKMPALWDPLLLLDPQPGSTVHHLSGHCGLGAVPCSAGGCQALPEHFPACFVGAEAL